MREIIIISMTLFVIVGLIFVYLDWKELKLINKNSNYLLTKKYDNEDLKSLSSSFNNKDVIQRLLSIKGQYV